MLEWNLAIICNCAPSMRAFFREYLKDTVDKALNSLSSRSRYKETNKDTIASQQNIELKRTFTVESEKPFNVHTSVTSEGDASSTNSSHPQAHTRNYSRTYLDAKGPDQFVPAKPSWSTPNISITSAGPIPAQRPYGEEF